MDIQNILLVLDSRHENQPIVDKAIYLAKRYGAQVEIALFEYSNPLTTSYLFDQKGLEEAQAGFLFSKRKWADNFVQRLRSCEVNVSVHVEWAKNLPSAVVERARLQNFDLIMKATHNHSLIDKALMTHADWQLMRETPVPLLLARDEAWGSHLSVAAAVDPMHSEEKNETLDHKILMAAHDLSCKLPAEFHVIHAFEPLATGVVVEFDALIANYDDYRSAVRDKHKEALGALLETETEPCCDVHFEEGAPEIVIPQIAKQECIGLIVLGAVARSGLDRVIIGSTAERLLDQLDCDLFVLRSDSQLGMV